MKREKTSSNRRCFGEVENCNKKALPRGQGGVLDFVRPRSRARSLGVTFPSLVRGLSWCDKPNVLVDWVGLSSTSFQIPITHANISSGAETGYAMKTYAADTIDGNASTGNVASTGHTGKFGKEID